MFGRSSSVVKRKSFSFKQNEIIEDIEAICASDEHREKLFMSLDNKVPQNNKLREMEKFLKDFQKLEEAASHLASQKLELELLADNLKASVDEIKDKIAASQ